VARVGEKVPFAKKGRFGVVSGSVEEYFSPFHLQIETSSTDDLDEDLLMQKVAGLPLKVFLCSLLLLTVMTDFICLTCYSVAQTTAVGC